MATNPTRTPGITLKQTWELYKKMMLDKHNLTPAVLHLFESTFYAGASGVGLTAGLLVELLRQSPSPEKQPRLDDVIASVETYAEEVRQFAKIAFDISAAQSSEEDVDPHGTLRMWVGSAPIEDVMNQASKFSSPDDTEEFSPTDVFEPNRIALNGVVDTRAEKALIGLQFGDGSKVIMHAADAQILGASLIAEAVKTGTTLDIFRYTTASIGKGDRETGKAFLADLSQWLAENFREEQTTIQQSTPRKEDSKEESKVQPGFPIPFDGKVH